MTDQLPPHPAKFSDPILDVAEDFIQEELNRKNPENAPFWLLDPFAGTGRVHELGTRFPNMLATYGVEIEPEWAAYHERTIVGNALDLPIHWTGYFDFVFTSPTYGNRMADHHNAKDASKRITYKHQLGRDPNPESSAVMHFGDAYMSFHEQAWAEVSRVLSDGGLFILNVSDFIRKNERVDVCGFHVDTILSMGFTLDREIRVPTRRMGFGANSKVRVEHEMVYSFRKARNQRGF